MPRLSPSAMQDARAVATWVLRLVAIVLLIWGSYLVLKKVLFSATFGSDAVAHLFRVYEGIGEEHSTYRGLAALLVGGTIAVTSRRLARWVVVLPRDGCPRCGYSGPVTTTCPECGQQGLHADPAAPRDHND